MAITITHATVASDPQDPLLTNTDWNANHVFTGTLEQSQNNVAVDGVTVTGSGTPGNPLVAVGDGTGITELTGDVTAIGPGSAIATVPNATVIGKLLTGFSASAGVVAATDTILGAFNKIVGNMAALVTGPATATDNAIARYDGTTGELIQDSGVIIDDLDNVTGAKSFRTTGAGTTSATTNFRLNDSAGRSMVEVNDAGYVGISCPPSALWKLDFTGQYFQMGSDSTSNNLRTDATNKLFGTVCPHYTNANNPVWVIGVQNTSASNVISIGGGVTSGANAATAIQFATNSTNNAGVGVVRLALTNTIMRIGSGDNTSTPAAMEIRAPRTAGVSNTAGVNQTYVSGFATGNANSGDHIWQSATIGSSGSTTQTVATRMTLKGGTGYLGIGLSPTGPFQVSAGVAEGPWGIDVDGVTTLAHSLSSGFAYVRAPTGRGIRFQSGTTTLIDFPTSTAGAINLGYARLQIGDSSSPGTSIYLNSIGASDLNLRAGDGNAARTADVIISVKDNIEVARFTDTGKFTLGVAGTTAGSYSMAGATSGTVTFDVPAVAGTNTLSFPAATDTLVGKATTDTLTNKTLTTPVINQPNIVGTTTNDNAAAGSVGEYVTASVVSGSAITLTTATQTNVTSISLTAGDWDVCGTVGFVTGGTTVVSASIGSISTTSATLGSPTSGAYFNIAGNVQNTVSPTGTTRISLSATTTVYLVAYSTFITSTQKAYGFIGARRVR